MYKTDKNENDYKKYLWIYLGITFGLSWGLSLVYLAFYDVLSSGFGELTLSNPLVILTLNSPSVAGILVYFIYGGWSAVCKFLKKLVPNKQEAIWFLILSIIAIIFYLCMHYGSRLFNILLPEVTMSIKDRIVTLLKNIYEETGLLGGAFGWYGFLLPYLQRKNNSAIKSGLITGLVFALFVLPGYLFSSFEAATIYPFYVIQLMLFSVFIAFVFNLTRGNVIFFIFLFWLIASGSKIQFYSFIVSVQILQAIFFAAISVILYQWFKKTRNKNLDKEGLYYFPDFIDQ